MRRYIDADKLQEEFKELHGGKRSLLIDAQPTADVRENVKGEWTKENGYVAGDREWKCSVCGEIFWNGSMDRYHYCPKCGAQMMRGEA